VTQVSYNLKVLDHFVWPGEHVSLAFTLNLQTRVNWGWSSVYISAINCTVVYLAALRVIVLYIYHPFCYYSIPFK